eukprot:3472781-Rhodomonas_salina.1
MRMCSVWWQAALSRASASARRARSRHVSDGDTRRQTEPGKASASRGQGTQRNVSDTCLVPPVDVQPVVDHGHAVVHARAREARRSHRRPSGVGQREVEQRVCGHARTQAGGQGLSGAVSRAESALARTSDSLCAISVFEEVNLPPSTKTQPPEYAAEPLDRVPGLPGTVPSSRMAHALVAMSYSRSTGPAAAQRTRTPPNVSKAQQPSALNPRLSAVCSCSL